MITHLFTAVHPHSSSNLQGNFVSPQPETVTDISWFLGPSAVSSLLYGLQHQCSLDKWIQPCFSTLTKMKGRQVCVKMKLGARTNRTVFTEQIDMMGKHHSLGYCGSLAYISPSDQTTEM